MKAVKKILGKGDLIYSAQAGQPMKILEINDEGIYTEEDFFSFDEAGDLYFLHPKTFEMKRSGKWRNKN